MGDKYLVDTCKFKCSNAEQVNSFRPIVINPSVPLITGKKSLTKGIILIKNPATLCRMLPNPPGPLPYLPCILSQVLWHNCSKNKAGGESMLNTKSYAQCLSLQGKLTPEDPSTNVEQNSCKSVAILKYQPVIKREPASAVEPTPATETGTAVLSAGPIINQPNKQYPSFENLKCPYSKDKKKCLNCEYANSNETSVDSAKDKGNSQELKKNYRATVSPSEFAQEESLFTQANCGYEAHHIISTKDVMEKPKAKTALKLFNYYKLEINDARNCILLPGIKQGENFGKLEEEYKRELAIVAMNFTGRQWHRSGHSYGYIDHEDFENDYATLVTEMLCNRVEELDSNVCRKENYESGKAEFEKLFYNVVDGVRNKLVAFYNQPDASKPLYVSRIAFMFAHAWPNEFKFLFISKKNNQIIEIAKYKATRTYRSQILYTYDFLDSKDIVITDDIDKDLMSKVSNISLHIFLQDIDSTIDFAFVDESKGKINLPININKIVSISKGSFSREEYISTKGNEMAVSFMGIAGGNDWNLFGTRLWEDLKLDE